MRIRISARKSDLARLQAYQVGQALQKKQASLEIQYNFRESLGDKNLTDPLWKMPEKGVFTEDFVQDLLEGRTDLVVHSWKDLPTERNAESLIAATLPRADQRDMVLIKKASWGRPHLQIFSSSPRREMNISNLLPELIPWTVQELKFESVRGNVQTRVRKLLENSEVDGLILAKAALDRLLGTEVPEFSETKEFLRESLQQLRWMVLPLSANPNAAAQGALAVEVRRDREDLLSLLKSINCERSYQAAQRERDLLTEFGGGCHLALGMSVLSEEDWTLTFVKGRTPAGEYIEKRELSLIGANAAQVWPAGLSQTTGLGQATGLSQKLWSLDSSQIKRKTLSEKISLKAHCGYVVSRIEAWPENLTESRGEKKMNSDSELKLWTSGLTTWKKLAKKGVWVLGTFDGLGDQVPPATEAILGSLSWVTLTHQRHPTLQEGLGSGGHLVTYETQVPELNINEAHQFFFWKSSSQFLQAVEEFPWIQERFHASGPGSTWRTLKNHLPLGRRFIFLNEKDWREKVEESGIR